MKRTKITAGNETTKMVSLIIPPLTTGNALITVRGMSALILHAWGKKAKDMIRAKQQKLATKAGKEAKDPEKDFNESRYLDEKGRDCVPAVMFKSCAVEAGTILDIHKTDLRKSFFVGRGADLIPIKCKDGPVIREDMVRVGMGVADMRYRPEYRDWSCDVPVEFNPRLISIEQLYNLFNNAGYSVGIGEWRPQRNGQYGRFQTVAK